MATPVQQRRIVRFGLFEAHLATGELFKAGRKIPLEGQPFLVLELLLGSAGELISREVLRSALWPDGSFVDFDRGINVAVRKLREALSDSAENPLFIETLSRRGYRFIAPVELVAAPGGTLMPETPSSRRKRWVWVSAAAAAALLGAGLLYRWETSARASRLVTREFHPVPLTSYPGEERTPALSPDGKQVAFSWAGPGQNNPDIYLKLLDTTNPVRLTTDPAADDMPAWSPDGRKIAFVRTTRPPTRKSAIYVIPALGGAERKLRELAAAECYPYGTLSWSGDGEWVAFADRPSGADPYAIYAISVQTGKTRSLTFPNRSDYGDVLPAFSPDGGSLAFFRLKNSGIGDISISPGGGGPVRRVVADQAGVSGLSWTSDAAALLYSAGAAGETRIWRVPASGGTPVPLGGIGGSDEPRGLSQSGNTLIFSNEKSDQNIWRVRVRGSQRFGPPEQLIASTRDDSNPQPSPDGTRIAFASNRSGSYEIWVAGANGTDPERLTSVGRSTNAWPTWSPDGMFIAFNSDLPGRWHIYVVDSRGGKARALTSGSSEDSAPSWSRDGNWIYYTSNRGGTYQIWRIPPAGGQPEQVTRGGGSRPAVSPDGKRVYYARRDGIWSIAVEGGDETSVLAGLPDAEFAHWVPVNGGLYYRTQEQDRSVLKFLDFRMGSSSLVMSVEKPWDVSALAASPDGRYLLFDQIDQSGSDLMLVENFR